MTNGIITKKVIKAAKCEFLVLTKQSLPFRYPFLSDLRCRLLKQVLFGVYSFLAISLMSRSKESAAALSENLSKTLRCPAPESFSAKV